MAGSLQIFVSLKNPSPGIHLRRAPTRVFGRRPPSSFSSSFAILDVPRRLDKRLWAPLVPGDRRTSSIIALAASHDESHSDIEVEKEKSEAEVKAEMSQEAWKRSLEFFKAEALKVKTMSEEAYEIYSKKTMEILMDRAEKLKIQADKAKQDLSIIAKEISEEGKEYLSAAAKNSPDSVKDVVEAYASIDELKNISELRDFYLGIPYGSFLAIQGFLNFMLTGSIEAIRFGVILGTTILALSVSSLRLWKTGKAAPLLLKGQTAIATFIFLRHWLLCSQGLTLPRFFMLFISGGMAAFYVYRIIVDGRTKG